MASAEQHKMMHYCSVMYYLEYKTQNEIAKELGISRPKVSRMLSKAREEGIVDITVNNPFSNVESLTRNIKEKLNLAAVVVVPGEKGSQSQIQKRIGRGAAHYLGNALQRGDKLGIGWGRSLYAVAQEIKPDIEKKLSIVPLMGGLGQVSPSFQVHSLSRMFTESFGGVWQPLYVPAIVEDPIILKGLINSKDVSRIVETWNDLSVAIFGVGNIELGPDVRMLFSDYMEDSVFENLKKENAVGDICMRFFDLDGTPIENGLPGVISIEINQLKKVPQRIGVAGGKEKALAILGAIQGKLLNVLITDETAATEILKLLN